MSVMKQKGNQNFENTLLKKSTLYSVLSWASACPIWDYNLARARTDVSLGKDEPEEKPEFWEHAFEANHSLFCFVLSQCMSHLGLNLNN